MKKKEEYSLVVHEKALEFLLDARRTEQRQIVVECAALAKNPFMVPDYERVDADGRSVGHLIRGRFAISYWVDHAEKTVLISRIDPADL